MRAGAFAAIVSLACCTPTRGREAHAWPALPTNGAGIEEVVRRETVRAVAPGRELGADAIVAAIEGGAIAVGFEAVVERVQAALDGARGDAYVLAGTWHDAPGQIDAFRRLVGALRGLDVVAVETFRADGAWAGAPTEVQRGDDAALEAYVGRGDREAFAALARGQREADYAAWKLDYVPTVLDLLIEARASGLRLRGCDMPAGLQERSGAPHGELRNRLREIHCVRSLPDPPAGRSRRAALLWGDAHLEPEGLRRFLPPSASVLAVHLVGTRQEPGALEVALAKDLALAAPVLVPLGSEEAALLLPDATLGARVDRVLAPAEPPLAPGVSARAREPGTLRVGDRRVDLGPDAVTLALPEGEHAYVFTSGRAHVVGVLRVERGHRIELSFGGREVGYLERARR